ncbi:hypothetical protein QE250_08090 [Chromatiaceae bacterium AAb-1]|nr:hypothetical protein [Chromatiaceae bacterium AAb-1]
MFDLHNHILPGIDDGARETSDSLALLQLAHEQGITHVLATPHIHPGRYDNTPQLIRQKLQALQQQLAETALPVKLAAAAEIRICPEILPMAQQQLLPFIGRYQHYNVVLLELPHSHIPAGTDKLISWLLRHNILPMIAHPERNRELQASPQKIVPFISAGCLFQLTAAAITGEMGEKPQLLATTWLDQKLFYIVASDAHSVQRRPPRMAQAYQIVRQSAGEEYAEQLFNLNPGQLSQPVFAEGMLL